MNEIQARKELYKSFADKCYIPVFGQAWWLDIVTDTRWDVAIAKNKNEFFGALPYFRSKKYGITYQINPHLTPRLGPYLAYPEKLSESKKFSFEKKVINELFLKIPDSNLISHSFDIDANNPLPFYWNNFQILTRNTQVIRYKDKTKDINSILGSTARRGIKKAKENLIMSDVIDSEQLYGLIETTFNKQKAKYEVPKPILVKLIEKSKELKIGKVVGTLSNDGELTAALFYVWDQNRLTLIAEGSMPEHRNSYGSYLLRYYAIQHAHKMKLDFDFKGSMIESIEHVNREFGGEHKNYLQIKKVEPKILRRILTF